jgi:hypothetical protein
MIEKSMKRINAVLLSITSLITVLSLPQAAYAGLPAGKSICPQGQFAALCNFKLESSGIVGNIVILIVMLSVFASLVFLIIGALRWITSGGEEAKVKSARSTIIAAIVGLIISLGGYFVVGFFLQVFTGEGLSTFNIPKLVP